MARIAVSLAALLMIVPGHVAGQQPNGTERTRATGQVAQPAAAESELAARREHVSQLERLCEKIQNPSDKGLEGGEQEKPYLTQTALELARVELAKAAGDRASVAKHYELAIRAADRAVPAVRSASEAGACSVRDLLDILQTQADVKAARARLAGDGDSAADRRGAASRASEQELAARREHVRELEQICNKLNHLVRLSDKGLGQIELRVAQTRLELAKAELAKAEGRLVDVPAQYERAARAADLAVSAVRSAYESGLSRPTRKGHRELGEATLTDLLDALRTQAEVKAIVARRN